MEQNEYSLGEFEVTSGELVVSDPCYSRDVWCRGDLKDVKTGKWKAYTMIEDSEERNSALIIFHESLSWSEAFDYFYHPEATEEADFEVGVDSGQAGFFDSVAYQNKDMLPADAKIPAYWGDADHDKWYSHCCYLTLGKDSAGVVPGGVVASSGYGDGGYVCHYVKNRAEEIVYADIVFIGEDDEDEFLVPDSNGEDN